MQIWKVTHTLEDESDTELKLSFKFMCIFLLSGPHLWRSGSTLETGRREVTDSIPSRAC